MGLHSLANTNLASILGRDGESITYTVKGSFPQTIQAFYQTEQIEDEMGNYIGSRMEVVVHAEDVSDPKEGDTVLIGSDTWTVRKVQAGTYYHKLLCTRNERVRSA